MPSTRLTLACNAQQTQRKVVLVDLSNPSTAFDALLDLGKTKLRLKKASRLYASDGTELIRGQPYLLDNDALILISAGEEFVGNKGGGPCAIVIRRHPYRRRSCAMQQCACRDCSR